MQQPLLCLWMSTKYTVVFTKHQLDHVTLLFKELLGFPITYRIQPKTFRLVCVKLCTARLQTPFQPCLLSSQMCYPQMQPLLCLFTCSSFCLENPSPSSLFQKCLLIFQDIAKCASSVSLFLEPLNKGIPSFLWGSGCSFIQPSLHLSQDLWLCIYIYFSY